MQWALTAGGSVVERGYVSPGGVAYHGYERVGGSFDYGATDRLEIAVSVPRVLCFSDGDPSGCSTYARFNGAGFGLGFGLFRTRAFQVKASSGISVAVSSPTTFEGGVAIRTKWLLLDRFAIELQLGANKWLNPPPLYYQDQVLTNVSGLADLNFQASRHLLIYADANPYGPLDHIGGPKLELSGGASWTFDSATEIRANAGVYNVLPRHAWDTSIPGDFFNLGVRFWM